MEEQGHRNDIKNSSQKDAHDDRAGQMREGAKRSERIESMRERLYARGHSPEPLKRKPLSPLAPPMHQRGQRAESEGVRSAPSQMAPVPRAPTLSALGALPVSQKHAHAGVGPYAPQPRRGEPPKSPPPTPPQTKPMAAPKQPRSYRVKVLLFGIAFFVLALGLSSMFLFFGGNTISGDNISVEVSGPFAVGGGSEIPLQVSIANRNAIPIESATLIVEYPPGTQSATEPGRELFTERRQLETINSGEIVNIPVRAIVFGEENEEKIIHISVEYRVRGSNATFFKEAEPLRFKISSSPVVLRLDSVRRISSGQEVEMELAVASNAPTPLSGVLVKASYPAGFDFSEATPSAVSGQDTWRIESLDPEEEETITVRGIVVGSQDEAKQFSFSVGVPNERDQFNLASIFTNATTELTIEDPFLDIGVSVNNRGDETIVIEPGDPASVVISLENTLSDTIYDGKIQATLGGNALNEIEVSVADGGFYNSTTNTLTWDFVDVNELTEILPGKTQTVSFRLSPEEDISRTPEINLSVTVSAKRVFEDRVPTQLVGTASRVIKLQSETTLSSSALYSEGPFTNSGPIPPRAEEETEYTYLLAVRNGSNSITDAVVTATLPQYMTWENTVTEGDNVRFSASTRELTWHLGDLEANEYEEAWVQVSFLPSLSQVGTTPTILETQRLRATDRFTGTVIRSEAPALTTRLVNDPDPETHDGRVREE